MKLLLAVIRDVDDAPVVNNLVSHGYRVTRMASTGGFLKKGNVTLLIGVEAEKVEAVIQLLKESCCQPEEGQHRATVFILDAPKFEQV